VPAASLRRALTKDEQKKIARVIVEYLESRQLEDRVGTAERGDIEVDGGTTIVRIWRYLDLAKFVSLISSKAIYFSCPTELDDPFEGYLPRSHILAYDEISRGVIDQFSKTNDFAIATGRIDRATATALIETIRNKLDTRTMLRDVNNRFGVNCWHRNEGESAAMWKMYGNCVAIESTKDRLIRALNDEQIHIDEVRYMDFDYDPIDKGHQHYGLMIKRKAFEHEHELRAYMPLTTPGEGQLVKCNLIELIAAIHVAPASATYYVDAVKYIVSQANLGTAISVTVSQLLDIPDY
jgi:hypothetical protein